MKHPLHSFLNRKIVADHLVLTFTQIICVIASGFVAALSFRKLLSLDLTEAQIFAGILLSAVVPMLILVIALLLPLAFYPHHQTSQPQQLKA